MISQGAISNFAQAKPEERRLIFEEAAGVAKYKKRKQESLRKLERSNENLVRVQDIISELEVSILPLKQQANTAKRYLEKQKRLESIEISVIVSEVKKQNQMLVDSKIRLADLINEGLVLEQKQGNSDEQITMFKEKLKEHNLNLSQLQDQLLSQVDYISTLEKRLNEERLKVSSSEVVSDEQITFMKNKLTTYESEIEGLESSVTSFTQSIEQDQLTYNTLKDEYSKNLALIQSNQTLLSNGQRQFDLLTNIRDNKSNLFSGVKAILSQKHNLNDIHGIVADLFTVDITYQEALSKTLAATLQNIVVSNQQAAKEAISFLNKNKAGRATFIPLAVIKTKKINQDDLFIAHSVSGFINTAKNLVNYDSIYEDLFGYLLSTTLIVKDLDSANELAQLLKQRYKIVSLNGEIISVGGLITGGKQVNNTIDMITLKSDIDKYTNLIKEYATQIKEQEKQQFILDNDMNQIRNKINQGMISLTKVNEQLKNKNYLFSD
ncbi:MAG: hypothetical protein ACRCTA_00305, partial [Bacilli bacterium]